MRAVGECPVSLKSEPSCIGDKDLSRCMTPRPGSMTISLSRHASNRAAAARMSFSLREASRIALPPMMTEREWNERKPSLRYVLEPW